jgi:hypothetical protein
LLVAGAAIWLLVPRSKSSAERDLGALFAGALGCFGWGLCWSGLVGASHATSLNVVLFGVPCAVVLILAALRADTLREVLFAGGTLAGLTTGVIATWLGLDSLSALSCVVVGVFVAVSGAAVKARVRMIAGAAVALFGLGAEVWLAVHADDMLRWASLSVLGVLFIVGSAYVERHRARVAELWARLSRVEPRELESYTGDRLDRS